MLIGYARTSTSNQKYSLEDQIEKLTSKGCEKIFSEEISSVSSNRPEFEKSLVSSPIFQYHYFLFSLIRFQGRVVSFPRHGEV